jgi:hypothetical protein
MKYVAYTLLSAAVICIMLSGVAAVHAQQQNFGPPSAPISIHDVGTAATVVKATAGTLHTLTINTSGVSAVISVFDLATAACTGTPSTNVKAIITLPASGALPGSLLYDASFVNGICVQSTVASDLTITAF